MVLLTDQPEVARLTTLTRVYEANEQGLQFLRQRRFDQATQCFRNAIGVLSPLAESIQAGLSASFYSITEPLDCGLPPRIIVSQDLTYPQDVLSDSLSLYSRGFRIASQQDLHAAMHGDGGYQKIVLLHILPGLLVYNTALSRHLHGLVGPGNTIMLQTARSLYTLARKTFAVVGPSSHCITLGLLACINNCGHIASVSCQYHQVETCIRDLLMLMLTLDDRTKASTGTGPDDWDFFQVKHRILGSGFVHHRPGGLIRNLAVQSTYR